MKQKKYTTRAAWLAKLAEIQAAHPGKSLKQIWKDTYNENGGLNKAAAALGITPNLYRQQYIAMGLRIASHMVDVDAPLPIQVSQKGYELLRDMRSSSQGGL
jgi:hypothetical protein